MNSEDDFIVRVHNPGEVEGSLEAIRRTFGEHGFCIIRGVFESENILAEYARLCERFDPGDDIRRSGPVTYKMCNFQRLDCGDYSKVNARFSRMLARFFWNPDDLFSVHFKTLQRIRDAVTGRNVAYEDGCYEAGGKRYYEFPKILQYPRGGGFLNEHYDSYNSNGVANAGMSITRLGDHFSGGGIYYRLRSGEEFLVDAILEPGDIYLLDGATVHGVHAVDPVASIDLARLSGRVNLLLSSETFGPQTQ